MARCSINGREKHIRSQLLEDLCEAAKRANSVSVEFDVLMNDLPSGILHPDAIQRIHRALRQMIAAENAWMAAQNRLTDFLNHGIVSRDLNRRAQ